MDDGREQALDPLQQGDDGDFSEQRRYADGGLDETPAWPDGDAEGSTVVADEQDTPRVPLPMDAAAADVLEQYRLVPVDDDEYRS
jgi:hypothetical protein